MKDNPSPVIVSSSFWKPRYRSIRALVVFVLFYITFGLYITLQQERFIYLPPRATPECQELLHAEQVIVKGTRLYVHEHEERYVVLYHGNAGTVCDRFHYAEALRAAGWGYIFVAYSGFGDGTGHPTHERIRSDVHNVINFLNQSDKKTIYVIGESIGTGVASYHASVEPPDALLLVTPFDTLQNLARHHYWYYPTSFLVQNAYNNVTALQHYSGQVMIVHGTEDRIIPYKRALVLYENLQTDSKRFISVVGADHNNLWNYISIFDVIDEFLSY